MSVIASKRGESSMEFLATARKLQAYTIQKCVSRIPKRYTFYIGVRLANAAGNVYEFCKKGNSVYPLNQHEVQMRRDYFLQANAELQNLVSQIELAFEVVRFDTEIMNEWCRLINTEMNAIKGVLKADRDRYKNL